jgi:hypothetical protein
MPFTVLSAEARQQLEQERSRLIQERQTIVETVTAEIDRTIQRLDALLGTEPASTESTLTESAPIEATPTESNGAAPVKGKRGRGRGKRAAKTSTPVRSTSASPEIEPTPDDSEDAEPAPSPKKGRQRRPKPFDAKAMRRDFKGMTPTNAVIQVMAQADPEQAFTPDDLLDILYEEFDDADLSRARKSVAAILFHGSRNGVFEKVQNSPAQYQLVPPASDAASQSEDAVSA